VIGWFSFMRAATGARGRRRKFPRNAFASWRGADCRVDTAFGYVTDR
jgi:hypothetical protein